MLTILLIFEFLPPLSLLGREGLTNTEVLVNSTKITKGKNNE